MDSEFRIPPLSNAARKPSGSNACVSTSELSSGPSGDNFSVTGLGISGRRGNRGSSISQKGSQRSKRQIDRAQVATQEDSGSESPSQEGSRGCSVQTGQALRPHNFWQQSQLRSKSKGTLPNVVGLTAAQRPQGELWLSSMWPSDAANARIRAVLRLRCLKKVQI